MSWTVPKTWASEPLTSLDLNKHLRDNLLYLKERAVAQIVTTMSASTTSSSYVDVPNMTLNVTSPGALFLIGFTGVLVHETGGGLGYVGMSTSSADPATYHSVALMLSNANQRHNFAYVMPFTLSAQTHTLRLKWRVTIGTLRAEWGWSFWAMQID